jgi:hypothetical protein
VSSIGKTIEYQKGYRDGYKDGFTSGLEHSIANAQKSANPTPILVQRDICAWPDIDGWCIVVNALCNNQCKKIKGQE